MRSKALASLRATTLILAAAILLVGCSATRLSYTISPDRLKDMSRQGQLWIFDAENEIVVALDKLDEAKDAQESVKRRLRAAEKSLERAEKRNNRIGVELAEEWIKYLEAMEDWTKDRIEAHQIGVIAAQALVELAKAQVINREDLLGGKDFSVKDYQEQYDKLKKVFESERKKANKKRKAARERENRWWTLRQRFISQTGDYDSGLWIE
jgi:hypothetical protein